MMGGEDVGGVKGIGARGGGRVGRRGEKWKEEIIGRKEKEFALGHFKLEPYILVQTAEMETHD